MAISTQDFVVNGRCCRPPGQPVAVICFDGCSDEYLDAAIDRGLMPNLCRMAREGFRGLVRAALPSFTNVNNAGIATGVPPSMHGIAGNYLYDTETGQEVMTNSARFLRAGTILAGAARAGRKVAFVTAKDKLRGLLTKDLRGIHFSAEKAGAATQPENGIGGVEDLLGKPTPPIYSARASLYVLEAGAVLVEKGLADFLYLSLTDYVQHKFGPRDAGALEFNASVDHLLGRLLDLGVRVGLTADHGMNAKQLPDGSPNIFFLESELTAAFGGGFRVVLPITDPYVKHHGALGSFAMVYLPHGVSTGKVERWLMANPNVTEIHDRQRAAARLELPEDRIGDLVVLSGRDVVLGRTPKDHDLSQLENGLRSHGGRYEEMTPMVLSEPLNPRYQAKAIGDPRNFDIFDFTLNGAAHD